MMNTLAASTKAAPGAIAVRLSGCVRDPARGGPRPRRLVYRVIGVGLLIVPYVIGAPEPPEIGGNVPPGLVAKFVVASLAAAGVFWLLLGAITGCSYQRLGRA
jgi:hypothetical protein